MLDKAEICISWAKGPQPPVSSQIRNLHESPLSSARGNRTNAQVRAGVEHPVYAPESAYDVRAGRKTSLSLARDSRTNLAERFLRGKEAILAKSR
jgi:hypothetical protein